MIVPGFFKDGFYAERIRALSGELDTALFSTINTWTARQRFDNSISFDGSTITIGASGLNQSMNVPTGGEHLFNVNGALEASILANELQFQQPGIPAYTMGFKWDVDEELDLDFDGTKKIKFTATTIEPITTNQIALGTDSKKFKELRATGVVLGGQLRADAAVGAGVTGALTIGKDVNVCTSTTFSLKLAGKGETGPTAGVVRYIEAKSGALVGWIPFITSI